MAGSAFRKAIGVGKISDRPHCHPAMHQFLEPSARIFMRLACRYLHLIIEQILLSLLARRFRKHLTVSKTNKASAIIPQCTRQPVLNSYLGKKCCHRVFLCDVSNLWVFKRQRQLAVVKRGSHGKEGFLRGWCF
jgi:hypothetical protein